MAPPSAAKRTIVSPFNAQWLFVALAILVLLCSVAFVVLTYVKNASTSIATTLVVMIAGLLASIILGFLFPTVKGSRATGDIKMSIPWQLILPYSSLLVIAVWSFTVYGKYGKETDEDRQTDKGGAAQHVLAWCMMLAAGISVLNTLSIGPNATKGIAWLMPPFIAGAFVSLGAIWVQVRYLTTDG
jgi:hypothetical protein